MWIYCKQCKLDFEAVAGDIYSLNLVECPLCKAEIELNEHQVAILNIKTSNPESADPWIAQMTIYCDILRLHDSIIYIQRRKQ